MVQARHLCIITTLVRTVVHLSVHCAGFAVHGQEWTYACRCNVSRCSNVQHVMHSNLRLDLSLMCKPNLCDAYIQEAELMLMLPLTFHKTLKQGQDYESQIDMVLTVAVNAAVHKSENRTRCFDALFCTERHQVFMNCTTQPNNRRIPVDNWQAIITCMMSLWNCRKPKHYVARFVHSLFMWLRC